MKKINKPFGFLFNAAVLVVAVVALILSMVVAADGEGMSPYVFVCEGLGILCGLGALVLVAMKKANLLALCANSLSAISFAVATMQFFMGRMTWFMNLASKNNVTPMYAGFIVAAAILILTTIAGTAGSFLKLQED